MKFIPIFLVLTFSTSLIRAQEIKNELVALPSKFNFKLGTSFGFNSGEATITSTSNSKFRTASRPALSYGLEYVFKDKLSIAYHHIPNYYVINHSDIELSEGKNIDFYYTIKNKYINDVFSLGYKIRVNDNLISLSVGYSISLTSLFIYEYGISSNFSLTDSSSFNPNFDKKFNGIILGGGFEFTPFKSSKKRVFDKLVLESLFTYNLRKASEIKYFYSLNDFQQDYIYSFKATPRLMNWTILVKFPLLRPKFKKV